MTAYGSWKDYTESRGGAPEGEEADRLEAAALALADAQGEGRDVDGVSLARVVELAGQGLTFARAWRRAQREQEVEDLCLYVDLNVMAVVRALNAVEGVTTGGSCGGHERPSPCQAAAGEWFVTLDAVDGSGRNGWRAYRRGLAFLRRLAAAAPGVRLEEGPSRDAICGDDGADPDAFAAKITAALTGT